MATTMTMAGIAFAQIGAAMAWRTNRESIRSIGLFSNHLLLIWIAVDIALVALLAKEDPEQEREQRPDQDSLAGTGERCASDRHAGLHLLHRPQSAADDRHALDGRSRVGEPVDGVLGAPVVLVRRDRAPDAAFAVGAVAGPSVVASFDLVSPGAISSPSLVLPRPTVENSLVTSSPVSDDWRGVSRPVITWRLRAEPTGARRTKGQRITPNG